MTASFHVAATGTVTASSTTNTITLPGTLSAGDLMIIAASANYAVTSVVTPDTTFTKLASAQASGDTTATAEVWYAYAASGDAGAVCTITCGTASYPSTAFASYQNAAISSPIDSSATDHTTGGSDVTTIPCTGATTASANVLPVSVIGGGGASASPTLTAPSGYTIRSQFATGDYEAVAIADAAAISSSGTGYGSGSWTYGGGGGGATVTFGIKAAAAGPVSSSGSAAVAAPGASGTNEEPTASGGAGVGAAGTTGTASGGGGATNPSWDPSGTNAVGGAGYTSTFSDDFTGSSLNTSNWTAGWQVTSGVTPPINVPSSTGNVGVDGESAAYSSAQISVADSILTLAITETSTTVDSITYPYLGSAVTTNPSTLGSGKGFQQALGCFEARIKMTASGGFIANWPAWWLDGQTWPADGELDILEGLGGDAAFHVNSTDNEPAVGSSAPGESLSASQFADGNWHTFGLSWNETQCDFYYDGALAGSVATHVPIAEEYLVFDNTTGWQSGPEAAGTMQIDWVRVWEQPTAAVTLTPVAGLTNSFASAAALFQDFSGLGIAASGGQATVLCDDTYENALQSITQYNLTGSSLWAKMAIPSGAYEVGFQLSDLAQDQNIDTGDSAGLIASVDWSYDGTNLVASITQNQAATTVATLTYSATTHAYWKISESGGTVTWWTSTDGSTWTSRGTHSYTISVAALYVNIWGGSDSGSTANLVVSDLNGGPPSSVTSSGAVHAGPLRTTGTVAESGGTVTTSGSAGVASASTAGTGGPVVPVTSTGTAGLAAAAASGGVSPSSQEVWANTPAGTVSSGGTTAPAAGTAESWTVDVTAAFAEASASADPATFWYGTDADLPGEIFLCTGCPGGTGSQSLSMIRGADGTTPAGHAGGFRLVQVVTRASLETLQAAAVQVTPWFTAKSGGYIQGQTSVSTSAALANGTLRVAPLIVTETIAVAALGAEFTVAGDAASLFRPGIFADDGTGYPGALIIAPGSISTGSGNAGTVSTGGTPGVYAITIGSPPVLQPGLYWVGGVVQGVTSVQPTLRTGSFGNQFAGATPSLPGANSAVLGYSQASVTGALPGAFTAFSSASAAGTIPRVILKIQ